MSVVLDHRRIEFERRGLSPQAVDAMRCELLTLFAPQPKFIPHSA